MSEELVPEELPKKKKKEIKKERQLLMVEEFCKGCKASMALDQLYCASCGGKRIYNRLNFRNLFEDFTERFLNVENAFIRTFWALVKDPKDVIDGYVGGVRKKYMSAFSYFALALTITGIYMFLFRNWFIDEAAFAEFNRGMQVGGPETKGLNTAFMTEWVDMIFDYQSVLNFINIPLYAIVSSIVFWNYKKYNFVEHLVIFLYANSQVQIFNSLVGMLFLWTPTLQVISSVIVSLVPFFYTCYVLAKVFEVSFDKLVLKILLFFVVFFPVVLIVYGLFGYILFLFGVFDTAIDSFNEFLEKQKEMREAARAARDSISADTIKPLIEKVKDTVMFLGS